MTTMALTEQPVKRLFERLDFAPRPTAALGVVLERWEVARAGVIAPRRETIRFSSQEQEAAQSIFVHRFDDADLALIDGEIAAQRLLGACRKGDRLNEAQDRRGAVRLRRLFEEVRRAGQPVLAQFTSVSYGRDRAIVEVLAAPLSQNGQTIDSVLAAVAIKALDVSAPAWPLQERAESALALFALDSAVHFGEEIARTLGVSLSQLEDRAFEDREYKVRPLESVRGRDVYVVSSLHGDAFASSADKLCKMLFFISALKDAGATRVTAVTPYLCFARKDRRTKPRDPVTTRYVAQLFESMATDCVICVDVHNIAAFQNAFRCETIHLDAQAIFAQQLITEIGDAPVAVVSPDLGGEKRAELFRQRLERMLKRPVAKAFMDKYRSEGRVVGEIFAGDVNNRIAIILDDLIAGGGTMARTATACRAHGATQVWAVATHGVFASAAPDILRDAPIDRLAIADTVPLAATDKTAAALKDRLIIVGAAKLFAEAIRRRHTNGSITELLEEGP
ncbi:ribose-phosphate pyrophosphokinase [Methylocystis sp. ATCC 49242]|uniref:ribose-phosphate diphosphokinase n=1 Tax=Methylocystis sp. ATCC 49242 TaxID=622637 RepID=UPI0001F8737A|nr:ribose-phosphate diphosphokinase [Methylocystis sp. ATCC 49242]